MLKNYFKIAWRNLMKNKVFSFINIFGLSAGLACCMLILLYLRNELSYDKHHVNIEQLYQVGTTYIRDGKEDRRSTNPAPMALAMKQDFPEVKETVRLIRLFAEDKTLFQYTVPGLGLTSFYETKGFLADPSFFRMFTYNFIEGDPSSALDNPNSIVISKEIAERIFGDQPALNKVIHLSSTTNGDYDYKITGVFKPSSNPSHIDGRFFICMNGGEVERYIKGHTNMAKNNMFLTYLMLKPGADPNRLEGKFPDFVNKYMGKDLKAAGFYKKLFLLPVKRIHLHADMPVDVTPVGSMTYLYILLSIAVFTLLIACINFMNLSTARSSRRSVEVGIRKVLGAERKALIGQFLGESLLLSLISFVFAIIIMQLLLPAFEKASGKTFALHASSYLVMFGLFLGLSIITGLLAGSYPAFYLSSFKPVLVLKGMLANSFAAVSLRKGLVIFQFVISVILIISSVVITEQMHFLRSADLGFAKDQQMVIPLQSDVSKSLYAALKNEIRQNKQVLSVGAALFYPGISNPSDETLHRQEQNMDEGVNAKTNWVDESLLQTLQIQPIAGRLFSPEFPGDTASNVILNEEAVNKMGFSSPEAAIGQNAVLEFQGQSYSNKIVGVVKDFHFQDLHVPITGYAFYLNNKINYNYIIAHITGDAGELIRSVEKSWHKLNPNEPFMFSFLDEDFQKNYIAEDRLSAIVGYFTIVAILISCLGLFGLATFSTEQRLKEIGVRKVLGASVTNVVTLLSKDFLKLVLIAVVIASPVAWWVMNKWLQAFAYRIHIDWRVFVITTLTALTIAFVTIGLQVIKAAVANPVKSLRVD
ncbi:MAG TPA: ABC transporter permease [Puia sp.]|nr:ABC transporter permease [Puia sp.]